MADAEVLSYGRDGDVAVLRLDDGKANALGHGTVAALAGALDRAEADGAAVLLVGRPGRLSAGFDLATMRAGPAAVRELVGAGAELPLRLYEHPGPTVVACTGHALAAGALLLAAADTRVGTRGDYRIGLNEVAIGMTLPLFGVELARDRLSPRHFTAAVIQSRIDGPDAAVETGWLDEVVEAEAVEARARDRAAELARLPRAAYAGTKRQSRRSVAERIRATLADDLARIEAR